MLIDKKFVLSAYECVLYEDVDSDYSTIFILRGDNLKLDEEIPVFWISHKNWYTKRAESYYDYYDSSLMLSALHPLTNEEAADIIERNGGFQHPFIVRDLV